MTVFRNEGRWDTSNVIFDGRMVTLYDKQRAEPPRRRFHLHRLRPVGARTSDRRAGQIPAGASADLAELFFTLSRSGELAGLEVHERFYEIGSPAGLEDFERWLQRRP